MCAYMKRYRTINIQQKLKHVSKIQVNHQCKMLAEQQKLHMQPSFKETKHQN